MAKERFKVLAVTAGAPPVIRVENGYTGCQRSYILHANGAAETTYSQICPDGRVRWCSRRVPSTSAQAKLLHAKARAFTASAG